MIRHCFSGINKNRYQTQLGVCRVQSALLSFPTLFSRWVLLSLRGRRSYWVCIWSILSRARAKAWIRIFKQMKQTYRHDSHQYTNNKENLVVNSFDKRASHFHSFLSVKVNRNANNKCPLSSSNHREKASISRWRVECQSLHSDTLFNLHDIFPVRYCFYADCLPRAQAECLEGVPQKILSDLFWVRWDF